MYNNQKQPQRSTMCETTKVILNNQTIIIYYADPTSIHNSYLF